MNYFVMPINNKYHCTVQYNFIYIFSDSVEANVPKVFSRALNHQPLQNIDVSYSPLAMANHEFNLTAFAAHRMNRLRVIRPTVESHVLFRSVGQPVSCPIGKIRLTVRSTVNAPPAVHKILDNKISLQTLLNNNLWKSKFAKEGSAAGLTIRTPKGTFVLCPRTQAMPQMVQIQPPPVTTVHMQVRHWKFHLFFDIISYHLPKKDIISFISYR
jgi:hypothetical protein